MGFIKKIFRGFFGGSAKVQQLPAGSVTVDRNGSIVTSTVSSTFPKKALNEIGSDVLELFREARAAHMPLAEVNLYFGSLRITARELRGGAIIFLFPQTALMPTPNASRL
jgi:hypothetical protein